MTELAEKPQSLPRTNLRAYVPSQNFEVRAAEDGSDAVEFEGYAIRWDEVATIGGWFFSFQERFKKGAFKKTVTERGPQGNGQIKFRLRHSWSGPNAAKFLELNEDSTGLWFRAKTINTRDGKDLAVELREGTVDTLSVGFDAIREEIDKDKDPVLRTVIEARLYEISGVDWPAYEGAKVSATRAMREVEHLPDFLAELERELREGKVLSGANKQKLIEARDKISEVIQSAGSSEDDSEPEDEELPLEEERDATLDAELAIRERELELSQRGA